MQPENTLIVADDLSGAADCAIAFRNRGDVVIGLKDVEIETKTLSLDADTRRRDATEAADIVASLFVAHRRPGMLFFKKIDSTLRGHIGVEVAAARNALAELDPLVVVSPAFPATGRTMRDGRLFVHGVSIEKTEIGIELQGNTDLMAQLTRARLTVAHADLNCQRQGNLPDAQVLLCDAETGADLRHLVAVVRRSGRNVLWVGSGGLARVLAGNASGEPDPIPTISGPILFVVGSYNEISHIQARRLAKFVHATQLSVQALLSGQASVPDVPGDHIISIEGPTHSDSQVLVQAFAKAATGSALKAQALFLTGGETARAVLERLGVNALRLLGEIEPGVIVSRADDGAVAGQIIITKAGAFGTPQALRRVQRVLHGARRV